MAILGSVLSNQVGLQLLLSPLGSNVVIRTACCTIGIALPVYSTFKAIENKHRREQEKWLLYWAAYGSFSLVETFSDKILSWFPAYYQLKFAFLVWLQFPSNNGSKHLYTWHIRPFLLRHQARLDQMLDYTLSEMVKFLSAHQEEIQYLKTLLIRFVGAASGMIRGISPAQPQRYSLTIEGSNDVPSVSSVQVHEESDPVHQD